MVNMRQIRADWVEHRAGDEENDEYKDYAAAGALFDKAMDEHNNKIREVFVSLLVDRADLAHFVGADAMVYAVPLYAIEDEAEKARG